MLYILTPIFCAGLCLGTVFSFLNNGKVYGADVPVKQSGAYLDLNGSGKILNGFEGAQKENIYFGTNEGSAVKWRVLDTGDNNKYGSGSMLLWADKQLAAETYNSGPDQSKSGQPNYAYWSTSKIRASLNGGNYPNSVTGTNMPNATSGGTITTEQSWYGKLFSTVEEKSAVVAAGSYTTDNWGVDTSKAQYEYMTSNITATAYGVNGKYYESILGTGTAASAVKTSSNGVQETSSGDKLFLLDYYDINNTALGFGDSGLTYANKVAQYANSKDSSYSATWTESSGYYPGYYTGSGKNFNNINSDYLKFSGEAASYYWLRQAGRAYPSYSFALIVYSSGYVGLDCVSYSFGVRPAFNLDTTKLAYVTTVTPTAGSGFLPLTASVGTPEYKAYVKSSNYTSSGKASVKEESNNLYITYNNPVTGVSGGNLLVLLTKKGNGSADGSVDYQAAISMNGSTATATKQAAASLALPADVSLSTHDVTILYTSANGGNNSETIYCSYTFDGGINVPGTISAVDYDGSSKWISELQGEQKPDWLNTDIYNNAAFMTVESISYQDHLGSAATNLTLPVNKDDIINAGVYTVTLKLANGLKWSDNSTGTKSFTITINQISPHANPQYEKVMKRFLRDGLPKLTNIEGGVAGEFSWGVQQPQLGTNDYTWTFIPEDKVNYVSTDSGKIQLSFVQAEIKEIKINEDAEIFDNLTLEEIKERLGITAVYEDGSEAPLSGDAFDLITQDDPLPPGDGYTITVELPDGRFWDFTVNVTKAEMTSIRTNWINGSTFTYPVTSEEILKALRITTTWNYAGNTAIELTNEEKVEYLTLDGEITIGKPSLTVTYQEGAKKLTATITPTINRGTLDISGITFTGDTVTYSGDYTKLTATGNVVCAKSGEVVSGVSFVYTYLKDGAEVDGAADNGVANAGTYTVKLSFTHSNGYYEPIEEIKTTTLTINKAKVTGIVFNGDVKPEITGKTYTLEATGVPSWVSVEYYYNGSKFEGASKAGKYEITAKFTHDNPNYEQIDDITKTLTISDKPEVEGAKDIVVEPTISATYTGKPVNYKAQNVPDGVEVSYEILKDGKPFDGEEIIEVGEYTITVKFETAPDKAPIADKPCVVTVTPGTYDMDGVELTGARTVVYDGNTHELTLTGTLPDGVTATVKYYLNGEETTPKAVGIYDVIVTFTNPDPVNYKDIDNITATLTISDAVVTGISAAAEEGAKFDINNTLDDVKAKLTVTAVYDNGSTHAVTEFTLTCETLREGGLLEVGRQTITVTYNDGVQDFTTTVEIEVAKAKVALPVYNGTLSYSGNEIKPTAADFEGFDSALMVFVEDKTVAGLNAGTYKAVFALTDTEHYEWATATTLKKALFKVALYDLEQGEAEVEWKIAKAKISATRAEGKLPVFASESFTGSLAEIVGLKYYDYETNEEVAADALGYNTKYLVKAELLNNENFELDESAMALSQTGFEYTTAEKQLTIWEKIIRFVTVNWLWFAIGAGALLFLIILICIIASAKKKKRKREELAEQRRLEKEERDREERRLEREERMARMSQQQAPQMMMPQMMPQMMGQMQAPQAAQGAVVSGASSNEIAELKAEMAAMRTEATLRAEMAAKESAEIKAIHAAEQQVANLLARLGGDQVVTNGVTLDKLTELVEKTVERVLDRRESAAQASAEHRAEDAKEATPVCPPDAVMTTVTTTKIDTTKKAAQSSQAQTAPAGRTVVRNVVAPMPVDDGRIFDVGGFYKPADPIADMGFTDDENKE